MLRLWIICGNLKPKYHFFEGPKAIKNSKRNFMIMKLRTHVMKTREFGKLIITD